MAQRLQAVDDYRSAIGARARSVRILMENKRWTMAQHLGGMTVECIIKSGIVWAGGLTHWRCPGYLGNPKNPGHDLEAALRLLPDDVQSVIHAWPSLIPALDLIQRPPASRRHYPSLRYHSGEPSKADFQRWRDAYHEVVQRLHDVFKRYLRYRNTSWTR